MCLQTPFLLKTSPSRRLPNQHCQHHAAEAGRPPVRGAPSRLTLHKVPQHYHESQTHSWAEHLPNALTPALSTISPTPLPKEKSEAIMPATNARFTPDCPPSVNIPRLPRSVMKTGSSWELPCGPRAGQAQPCKSWKVCFLGDLRILSGNSFWKSTALSPWGLACLVPLHLPLLKRSAEKWRPQKNMRTIIRL